MDVYALAVLAAIESRNPPVNRIQQSGEQGDKLQTITLKLLSGFIEELRAYPDSQLVDQFWFNVEKGHAGLRTNSELPLVWPEYHT